MVHFGEVFSDLIEHSDLSIQEIASRIGCKQSNVYKMKQKESIDTKLLESVCRAFEVSPVIFFDTEVLKNDVPTHRPLYKNQAILGKAIMNIGAIEDLKNLMVLLDEKEKQLVEKERFIQYLLKDKAPV